MANSTDDIDKFNSGYKRNLEVLAQMLSVGSGISK